MAPSPADPPNPRAGRDSSPDATRAGTSSAFAWIFVLVAVGAPLLTGCENRREPDPPSRQQPSGARENSSPGGSPSGSAPDAANDESEPPDANSCFENCMRDNQMRAAPVERIREDCRAECD